MDYLLALFSTLGIEGGVVWLCGFKTRSDQMRVALINGVTHPLFFLALTVFDRMRLARMPDITYVIGTGEIAIVLVEWLLLSWLYPTKKRTVLLGVAVAMNSASALLGESVRLALALTTHIV